jgi:hypothetical protein
MLAWAAHAAMAAGDEAGAAEARAGALARQPGLLEDLRRAVATAVEEQDPEAAQQAGLLVEAIAPTAPVRRLPLAKEPPAKRHGGKVVRGAAPGGNAGRTRKPPRR